MRNKMEMPLYISRARIRWEEVEEESYLRDIPAIAQISEIEFHRPVTLLAGENGTGKSTLLEALAVAAGFNPEGGQGIIPSPLMILIRSFVIASVCHGE